MTMSNRKATAMAKRLDHLPDPKRFTGAAKAAAEWAKKHPNPLAFNRKPRK
jgi:hypothetical protein